MKIKLSQIEARLQALIEGSAARLFPTHASQNDLAYRLVDAMRVGIRPGPDGVPVMPNLFTLTVHPSQLQALQENRALLEGLTQTLREAGAEAGLKFASLPVLRVRGALEIPPGEIRVKAENSRENLPQTSDLAVEHPEDAEAAHNIPQNAFLIVDGMRIFPLTQAVINIGRRLDNQLVIDDPRVSRLHAQLRVVRERYVIFDLDSTGGTFVNGERVRQNILFPGDVISLAGLPMVYGQDPTGLGETQDYNPEATGVDGERPAGSKSTEDIEYL